MLNLNDPVVLHERPQSLGEEIANSVSHGLGLLLALAAFPILVTVALQRGNAMEIAGASVFATTMVLLYSTSMLFHAFPQSRTKRIFQVLDHSAIYFLIAGTYHPVYARRASRYLGLDPVRAGMEHGGLGYAAEGPRRRPVQHCFDVRLSRDGLAGRHRGRHGMDAGAEVGNFWLVAGGIAYTAGAAFFWRNG